MKRRIALAGLLAIVVGVQFVGSAAASTPVEDYGSRLKLFYLERNTPDPYTAGLNRIHVTPPMVFGDFWGQKVGWRAVVSEYGTTNVLKSQLQTEVTVTGATPAFTPIDIHIPTPDTFDSAYSVTIKLIWYGVDGTRDHVVSHQMQSAYFYDNHHFLHHLWDDVVGYELQTTWVDGP